MRRLPGAPRTAALLLALVAVVSACAGPDSASAGETGAPPRGRRVLVGLYDAKGPVHLELAPASHPDFADVYSRPRADAALKLAPDELVEDLLRDLAGLSFDALATAGAPPPASPGVRGWVSIQDSGRARTFVVPATGASPETLQAFAYMKLLINEYYTHVGGLQFVENPQGHDIFRKKP